MDWYYGCGIDDLVVPRDGGISDRLPSPDSWSEWGINEPGIFQSQYKRGGGNHSPAGEEDEKSLSEDAEMEDFCGGFSDECSRRTRAPNDQLDLMGSESTDYIFLRSMNEDLPQIESMDESYYFSPRSKLGGQERDVRGHGGSRYLKTHAFSPPSEMVACNSRDEDYLYTEDLSNFENNNVNGQCDEEMSLEESVLCELKTVMNQFTEKTRISFRDSLYRLAKSSDQHRGNQNQRGALYMETHPNHSLDEKTERCETSSGTESGTNVIDRAIASLMFSRTEYNEQDFPKDMSSNLGEVVAGSTKPCDHRQSFQTQNPDSGDSNEFQIDDAEVPIFAQMYDNQSVNGSMVLDFSSGV